MSGTNLLLRQLLGPLLGGAGDGVLLAGVLPHLEVRVRPDGGGLVHHRRGCTADTPDTHGGPGLGLERLQVLRDRVGRLNALLTFKTKARDVGMGLARLQKIKKM